LPTFFLNAVEFLGYPGRDRRGVVELPSGNCFAVIIE